jgi:hypothetical protein
MEILVVWAAYICAEQMYMDKEEEWRPGDGTAVVIQEIGL